jgi:hypothetical protein
MQMQRVRRQGPSGCRRLIRAVAKYDPKYTEKVKLVVDAINEKLSRIKQIHLTDVNQHVDFDSHRYIRLLCRRGYLTPSPEGTSHNRKAFGNVVARSSVF